MKKVVILTSDYALGLEDSINDFLKTHIVADIQYQMSSHVDIVNCYGAQVHSAMIVYEEEE